MSKKVVLISSIVAVLMVFILSEPVLFGICRSTYTFAGKVGCLDKWHEGVGISLLIFFPVLFFSLLTYKLRDEVFRAWLHFAYWWVPLSIIVTLILSVGPRGGGFGIPNLLPPEGVAAFFAGVFSIISLIIIVWKYIAVRRK